ncbi:ImmA/IrrE family metallo-endopeptidase [Microbacterium sp. 1.5R]|uniref:ImmA/IrrE family metallo-endopeptidase n=1 Tax=Microbacterium sp. 1.5R TaxID=1916917 RepID=UPI0011A2E25B|nr:ImmA/IrrE family metallo-endopeptidase [Microbacterium sp. 1.5R]
MTKRISAPSAVEMSRTDDSRYDPWRHAATLGIPVAVRRLRSANGYWFPEYREILLGDHLRPWAQMIVLAHEIGHASLGHVEDSDRNEWEADRFACSHLVPPAVLDVAVRRNGSNLRAIRSELGVTSRILRAGYTPFADSSGL